MLQPVQPCEQFCHSQIKLWRNVLVQLHLHQQTYQFFRFMHINAVLSGALDDRTGNQPAALRHYPGGEVVIAVCQSYGRLAFIGRAHVA